MSKKMGKILNVVLLLFGFGCIVGGFFDSDLTIGNRVFTVCMGVAAFIIALVDTARWIILSLFFLTLSATSIYAIFTNDRIVSAADLLGLFIYTVIACCFGYKAYKRLAHPKTARSKSTKAKSVATIRSTCQIKKPKQRLAHIADKKADSISHKQPAPLSTSSVAQETTFIPYTSTDVLLANMSDGVYDEMFIPAVDMILETGEASVSALHRQLKLGYARSVRIIDEMESKGIVGPFKEESPREILITKAQWDTMPAINVKSEFDEIGDSSFANNEDMVITSSAGWNYFLRTHIPIDEIYTKVVGVSYSNDDGTSRQEALQNCHSGEQVSLEFFTYEGAPAYAVFTSHGQIGNLSAHIADKIYNQYTDYAVVGTIEQITGGNDLYYGCNLLLTIYQRINI